MWSSQIFGALATKEGYVMSRERWEKAFKRPQKCYERCPSHTFNSVYEVDRKEGQQQEAQPRRQEAGATSMAT